MYFMGTSPVLHTLFFTYQKQTELITWRGKDLRHLKPQVRKSDT